MLGISRQRKGQVTASDGAGTTSTAIAQSTAMTEEIFRKFEKFEQKEMQGLLDVSKHAFRGGKKIQYIAVDYRNAWLDIEGAEYGESEFGSSLRMLEGEPEDEPDARAYIGFGAERRGAGLPLIFSMLTTLPASSSWPMRWNKQEALQQQMQKAQLSQLRMLRLKLMKNKQA